MARYQKHMQQIHNQATAQSIESAVQLLTEDIIDFLIKAGVQPGGMLLKDIRNLSKYEYKIKKDD